MTDAEPTGPEPTSAEPTSAGPTSAGPIIAIDRATIRVLQMPLCGDFATSFARVAHREMVIVRLESGERRGYGEAPVASRPHYSAETSQTALHVLRDWMLPAVVGQGFATPAELLASFAFVRGHRMARAAVEWAFRDLLGQVRGEPLAAQLGVERDRALVGVSLGIPQGGSIPALLEQVERHLDLGYARVKVKVTPTFLREPLAAVRERWPELRLAADANGAFTLADADALAALDDLGLLYLEQPIAPYDLVDHARLRERLATPICLDESIEGPEDLASAIALGALDILNLKPGRVGGATASLAMAATCREAGLPLWCGGMLETGIGRAAAVALAASPGFTLEADLSASSRYYADDLVDPPFELGPGSTLRVPTGPGLGVQVLEERIERATTAAAAL